MPVLWEISFDCSIQLLNRTAAYTMPETDARMLNTVTISSAQLQRAARLSSPKSET